MKVWLCSDGYYSAYRVTAIFTSEARARDVTKARGWGNEPEPIELDPEQPAEVDAGLGVWTVYMYRDGNLYRIGPDTDANQPASDEDFQQLDVTGRKFSMWARDREHAMKIANERRIAWLAAGKPE